MIKNAMISALAALSLTAGAPAFAQGNDRHDDRGGAEQRQGGGRSDHERDPRPQERGAGPQHSFHKGDRLPTQYRNQRYVVEDWRGRHLSAPPRGYHWVQTGGDYVLVAITTGVILQLLNN